MVDEYLTKAYLPAARRVRDRLASGAKMAKELTHWGDRARRSWSRFHIDAPNLEQGTGTLAARVSKYLGEMDPRDVRVQLYADPLGGGAADVVDLAIGDPIAGTTNGYVYSGPVRTSRPPDHFTVRVVPIALAPRSRRKLALIHRQKWSCELRQEQHRSE